MKNSIYLVVASFLLLGCSKEEDIVKTTLLDNPETNIQIAESKDNIEIYIESLLDTIDHIMGNYPASDFCNIAFDVNGNSQIDSDIDFGFGSQSADYDICSFYLRDSITISPCGVFETTASFTASFEPSALNPTPHVQWHLSVPKGHFENAEILNFVIKTYQPASIRTYPESNQYTRSSRFSFDQVLTYQR